MQLLPLIGAASAVVHVDRGKVDVGEAPECDAVGRGAEDAALLHVFDLLRGLRRREWGVEQRDVWEVLLR